MSGLDKCTYIIAASAGKAPGYKITSLGWTDWQHQWIEFSSDAITGTGQMPSSSKTPVFMGSLPETEGPFLNPSKLTLTSYPQTIDEYHDYGDTSLF